VRIFGKVKRGRFPWEVCQKCSEPRQLNSFEVLRLG
jgi:hypothetical protein